jgi:hypothetical protein
MRVENDRNTFMIQFSEQIGFWSKFIFWYVFINGFLCLVFTLVVIIGGFHDLRYLFTSLREDNVDEKDDGRVIATGHESKEHHPAIEKNEV